MNERHTFLWRWRWNWRSSWMVQHMQQVINKVNHRHLTLASSPLIWFRPSVDHLYCIRVLLSIHYLRYTLYAVHYTLYTIHFSFIDPSHNADAAVQRSNKLCHQRYTYPRHPRVSHIAGQRYYRTRRRTDRNLGTPAPEALTERDLSFQIWARLI